MILPYTYIIKNTLTGHFYYGSRCKNVTLLLPASKDLWIRYFTSSKYVNDLIVEYGAESFIYEIILENVDYDICYWLEQELIKNNIDNELCLNKQYVDKHSGMRKFSKDGVPVGINTRRKMSISRLDTTITEETREKQSLLRQGRTLNKIKKEKKKKSIRTYEEISGIELGAIRRKKATDNAIKYHKENPKFGNTNPNAKCFEMTSPDGKTHILDGTIGQFCKDNRLNRGLVINTAKGRRESYRGWKIKYVITGDDNE